MIVPAPKRNRWQTTIRVVGTITAFALLVYLLSQQGWDEINSILRRIPPWRIVFAVVLMMVSRFAVITRWHVLLRTVDIRIPYAQSARITFAGLFASNFLPTTIGGDVVRIAMALQLGYDRAVCAASVVADRLLGMVGMATAIPFGITALLGTDWTHISREAALTGFVSRAGKQVRDVVERLVQASLLWAKSPRGVLFAFGMTWIHQLSLFGIVWLLLTGMGETIPFWTTAGLWSFTYFVTLLPISIGGLGLQALSMTFIFTTVGGVTQESAAIAALMMRTLQALASIPGGFLIPRVLAELRRASIND